MNIFKLIEYEFEAGINEVYLAKNISSEKFEEELVKARQAVRKQPINL